MGDNPLGVEGYYGFNPVNLPPSAWADIGFFDHMAWANVQKTDVMQQVEEQASSHSRQLAGETFFGLYNTLTPLRRESPEGLSIPHAILKRAEEMPEFQALRADTGGDELTAVLGTSQFMYDLLARLPEEVKEAMQQQQQAQDAADKLRQQMGLMQLGGGTGSGGEGGEGGQMDWEGLQSALAEAEANAQQATQDALNAMANNPAQTEQAIASSARDASDILNEAKSAAQGMGYSLGSGGGASIGSVDEIMKLMEYLKKSRQLKLILDMLGWARQAVDAEVRKKADRGRVHLVDYTPGPLDLDTLAEEEIFGLLAEPGSLDEFIFGQKLAGDQLLHEHYLGEEPRGKGPVVFLEDQSGSMGGTPSAVAKAVLLSAILELGRQRRRTAWIPFSGPGNFHVCELGLSPAIEDILTTLAGFYGGGTEPYAPLLKSLEIVESNPEFREGSVVILTDGAFSTPEPEFLERLNAVRQKPGVKVYAIVIGSHPGHADAFADVVLLINDLLTERDRFVQTLAPIF